MQGRATSAGSGDGESERAGTLGELVARGLVARLRLPPGAGAVQQLRLGRLRIEVRAQPGESTEQLAERIIDRVTARLGGAAAAADETMTPGMIGGPR